MTKSGRGAFAVVVSIIAAIAIAGCADPGGGGNGRRDSGPGDSGPTIDAGRDGGPGCMTNADCPDDHIFCNGVVQCMAGRCVSANVPTCDDSITCTVDACDSASDTCGHRTMDSLCGAGLHCAISGCATGVPCEFDTDCDDHVFCNGAESCVSGICNSPGTRDCSDTSTCTMDACMEGVGTAMGMCTHDAFTDTLTNVAHCGNGTMCMACPAPAPTLHQVATCAAGMCGVMCETGYGDSDHDMANGCECMSSSATDLPELTFADTNCDGIDGDVAVGIFVAPSGNDGNDGSMAHPVATIQHGIALAAAGPRTRREVYVSIGTYNESITLSSGVSVFGGYDASMSWRRDMANVSEINGGTTAVYGTMIRVATEIQLMSITSAGATATAASSYGVRLYNNTAQVRLIGNTIHSGNGGVGGNGTVGSPGAPGQPGVNGSVGVSNGTGGAGGAGGMSSCGSAGGAGGSGRRGNSGNDGVAGTTASPTGVGGAQGPGGAVSSVCFANAMTGGMGGDAASPAGNGGNGTAAATLGTIPTDLYVPADGHDGLLGDAGGGGGGGGAGGGGVQTLGVCNSDTGGGGGGGSSGGCGGNGGTGGHGGGGSFGVFAVNSSVLLQANEITSGVGGRGGNGGAGGAGGARAAGRTSGGGSADDAAGGGPGGVGAAGGAGGGGSGGPGGPSYAVFTVSTAISSTSNALSFTGGGMGGSGGGTAVAGPAGAFGTTASM